jgi:hypothetical protein
MQHVWSILCEKSSIDTETNLLSLFSCLEEISVVVDKEKMKDKGGKFILPANFQLVSFWSLDEKEVNKENQLITKVELVAPSGEVLNQFTNSFKVKSGARRFRNRANIQGVPVIGEGRYFLKLWHQIGEDYKLVANLPLDVKINYKLFDKNN